MRAAGRGLLFRSSNGGVPRRLPRTGHVRPMGRDASDVEMDERAVGVVAHAYPGEGVAEVAKGFVGNTFDPEVHRFAQGVVGAGGEAVGALFAIPAHDDDPASAEVIADADELLQQ